MIRRARAGLVLALCLSALAVPAVPASAVEPAVPPTTFTVDRVHAVGALNDQVKQTVYSPATVSVDAATGGVGLAYTHNTTTTTLFVAPPAGTQLAPGTYEAANAAPTASAGRIALPNACPSVASGPRYSGTFTVHEVTYDAAAVASLALDYAVTCAADGGTYAGSARHNTTRDYVLLRPTVAGDPRSGVGMPVPLTVTVFNAGTAHTVPGAAVLSGVAASDYAVSNDGCNGVSLAPGQECEVGLTFTPAALGDRRVRVDLPSDGHPRAAGMGAIVHGSGVAAPTHPTGVFPWPVAGGIRLLWTGTTGAVTSYTVHRRATAQDGWASVASVPAGSYQTMHTDTTLPSGSSAQYAVSAVGPGGSSSLVGPFAATRAATDPVVGTIDSLVLDVPAGAPVPSVLHDAAEGALVGRPMGFRIAGVSANSGTGSWSSAELNGVIAPGSYALTPDGPLVLTVDGRRCNPSSGTVDVAQVLFDDSGYATTLAASFAAQCFEPAATVRGTMRWHSTVPYAGVRVTQPAAAWTVTPGTPSDRTVTVRSVHAPVTFGAATLTGPDAASFTVVSNGCQGATRGSGGTCEVVVRATVDGTATRNVTLHVADDTPAASHHVALSAIPTTAPGMPVVSVANQVVGQTTVGWQAPASNGNSPVTAYRVYRQVGEETPVLVVQAPANGVMVDDVRPPGSRQRYGVAAVNAVGEGPVGWTGVVTTAAADVLYTAPANAADYGLRRTVPNNMSRDLPFAGNAGTPAASPDGTLVAYAQENGSGYDVFVRNADGTGTPRNLTGASMSGASWEYDPAFSNDGRFVAFTRETATGIAVWHIPVSGGTPTHRGNGVANPSWLPDSRGLVVADYSSESAPLLRISPTNARTVIAGTGWGDDPAVSPDGRWIAFSRYDSTTDVNGIAVVPVAGSTTPKVLADPAGNLERSQPSWRGDGTALAVVMTDYHPAEPVSYLQSVTWSGTTLATAGLLTNETDVWEPSWRTLGVRLSSAPYVTRSTATVGIALSAPFTSATCALDNGAAVPCTTSWTGTGLAQGAHTLVVRASAPGVGDRVLAHTFVVDTAAPSVSTSLPSTVTTLASSATFRYAGSDATGVASYDARYRRAPYNGTFGGYVTPAGWAGTRSTQLSLAVSPGSQYCFSVRARDAAGNVSGWTAERCTASPVDDRSLGGSTGWTRVSAGGYYRSTYTTTTRSGATLSLANVQAKRLVLVATRCSTCGTVAVYSGSTLVANVNLAYGTTQRAYQIALPVFGAVRTGPVTIKVTSSGKTVQIDGLGVSRV